MQLRPDSYILAFYPSSFVVTHKIPAITPAREVKGADLDLGLLYTYLWQVFYYFLALFRHYFKGF